MTAILAPQRFPFLPEIIRCNGPALIAQLRLCATFGFLARDEWLA